MDDTTGNKVVPRGKKKKWIEIARFPVMLFNAATRQLLTFIDQQFLREKYFTLFVFSCIELAER